MISVDLAKSYRLLNHGPTVLVTSRHGSRRNVMAAAWSMPVNFAPPTVSVVIEETSYTRELVDASGRFGLCVPARAQAELTLRVGSESGRDQDKFAKYGIRTGSESDLPLIEGCVAWLECRVIPEQHLQKTYDLFLGEITGAWADPRAFANGHWQLPPKDLQTLHYVAGGMFFVASETLEVQK
jgi:flavin reductase (DIM6/NTAB) family NADH-FMN oxidoreductase RutF